MLKVVTISGPSGSGNTTARYVFEERGYKIIENPPIEALDVIITSLLTDKYSCEKLCVILEIKYAKEGVELLKKRKDIDLLTIILTTSPESIVKRYSLSRHAHPLAVSEGISLNDAVLKEVDYALSCQDLADFFIDTTNLTPKELKGVIYGDIEGKTSGQLTVQFTSFGIKNDRPKDLDMFFDVRSLPNPYWVPNLKDLTGLDQEVADYVVGFDITNKLLDKMVEYLTYLLEIVSEDGRPYYNIGIACSGGQHRSVFVAEYLAKHFADKYHVVTNHRDINRVEKM
ncbi:MAG: hypothetical protein IJQ67_06290 [Bacilli bacterium]|nr:hypothetical protein [Bacilli bacterium]